jgi:hypothetical protein
MSLIDEFTRVRDALQRHLPRAATGSVVTLDEEGLAVAEPGVSLGDLARLVADLTHGQLGLPEGLPAADIRLKSLALVRGPSGQAELDFTVAWARAALQPPGPFALSLAELRFSMRRGALSAAAKAGFKLEELDLEVDFELPSQAFDLRLEPQQLAATAALLARRGLIRSSGGAGSAKIRELRLRGSLIFERAVLSVELEDLFSVGPVHLSYAAAQIDLGAVAGPALAAQAQVRVALPGKPDLLIEVDGEVDSAGWRVEGSLEMAGASLTINDLVDAFAKAFNQAPPTLPSVLTSLGLARLDLRLDTHEQSFSVDATLDWQQDTEIIVQLVKAGPNLQLEGRLAMAGVSMRLDFDRSASGGLLVGSFDAAGSTPLTLAALLKALKLSGAATLGATLDIRSLALALDGQRNLMLAAEVDAGIDLSRLGDLPLVGSLLPKGGPLGLQLTPYYLAPAFGVPAAARSLMPASLPLPDPLVAGPHVSVSLQLGGQPITLDTGNDLKAAQAPDVAPPGAPGPAANAADTDSGLTWKVVKKTFGPLRVARVGYEFKAGSHANLAFDAGLDFAGLALSVDGLGARYEFTTRQLTPRLRGLGIDLQRGPVEIGGAFLNADGDFLGEVVIKTRQFALHAVGGFSMVDGTPSMFAYGVLDMPIGGPPFFFVEGLAAGIGLHRSLHVPTIDQVRQFPLVTTAGVRPPVGKPAKALLSEQLQALHNHVSPRLGEYFVAAGLKFNSFRLLHGFALLVLTVGRDFEVDLIGTADFASPPDLPDNVPALARVQLDLLARIVVSEGFIGVQARLDPSSYVYSPLCHLSGGFAFYAWSRGSRAGDFVLSVGGYHPEYDRPSHYPLVPRVELKYQVSPEVYLKGDAYFALTPSVMMAGGGLHAHAQIGSLEAWADFSVDFWVAWEPFHYDARMHVGIGAKWKCFHTTASADLHIWGPDFSGAAHVEWFVFSFDLEFGAGAPSVPMAISVEKFMKSFLAVEVDRTKPHAPETHDATLGLTFAEGVIGDADATAGIPIVAPASLVITTSSRVPVTHSALGSAAPQALNVATVGIAPSAIAAITSTHQVRIRRRDQGQWMPVQDAEFAMAPLPPSGFPTALWASGPAPRNAKPLQGVGGFSIKPAVPSASGASTPIEARNIKYTQVVSAALALRQVAHAAPSGRPSGNNKPERELRDALKKLGLPPLSLRQPPASRKAPQILLGAHVQEPALG